MTASVALKAPPPRPSVIVCCYTMERIGDIHAAVSSVLKQTLPAHEIIVAVDHNDELCRALREQLPPSVAVVPNDGVRGISDNRNVGMRAATGDVIVYIDDDAVAESDWLEQLAKPFAD